MDALRFGLRAFAELFKELQQHQPLLFGEDGGGLFHGGRMFPKRLGDNSATLRRELDQAHAPGRAHGPTHGASGQGAPGAGQRGALRQCGRTESKRRARAYPQKTRQIQLVEKELAWVCNELAWVFNREFWVFNREFWVFNPAFCVTKRGLWVCNEVAWVCNPAFCVCNEVVWVCNQVVWVFNPAPRCSARLAT